MAGWTGLGDIFSDSKSKKFEMWTGLDDVFGDAPEASNIEQLHGDEGKGLFSGALSTGGPDGKQGWASPVISGLTGAASAYLGYQQMKLGKSQLEQNKKIFNLNFSNQAQSINTQLEDRQRSRVAGSAGGSSQAESVESYMAKNAIKSKGI